MDFHGTLLKPGSHISLLSVIKSRQSAKMQQSAQISYHMHDNGETLLAQHLVFRKITVFKYPTAFDYM